MGINSNSHVVFERDPVQFNINIGADPAPVSLDSNDASVIVFMLRMQPIGFNNQRSRQNLHYQIWRTRAALTRLKIARHLVGQNMARERFRIRLENFLLTGKVCGTPSRPPIWVFIEIPILALVCNAGCGSQMSI
jgi:hypothetical protein